MKNKKEVYFFFSLVVNNLRTSARFAGKKRKRNISCSPPWRSADCRREEKRAVIECSLVGSLQLAVGEIEIFLRTLRVFALRTLRL